MRKEGGNQVKRAPLSDDGVDLARVEIHSNVFKAPLLDRVEHGQLPSLRNLIMSED